MKEPAEVSYMIDRQDRIVSVNAAWNRFAEENDGAEVTEAHVIGRPIWDFIADETTRELYEHVLERVRSGRPTELTLRCDAPDRRRLIEMCIVCRPGGLVEYKVHQLCERERQRQPLLARSTPRSHERVLTCSWCNRFHGGTEEWLEVEDAMVRLELADELELPRREYVICPDCFAKVTEVLARTDPLAPEGLGAA